MMYKNNNVWCSRRNEWNVEKEKKKTCNGGQQWKKTMAVVEGNDVNNENGDGKGKERIGKKKKGSDGNGQR